MKIKFLGLIRDMFYDFSIPTNRRKFFMKKDKDELDIKVCIAIAIIIVILSALLYWWLQPLRYIFGVGVNP